MKLKYLVISDIHLGHNLNKTNNIVNNLREFFIYYNKELKNLDILFIAGDIFDGLLKPSSQDFILATEWLSELVNYCMSNNIILRILEGTPSHDWKQASVINTILQKLNIQLDFKYIDTLAIEHISKHNINVLYIPDEYKPRAIDTYTEVKQLLEDNKLDQVDIVIMHGAFHYQLPMIKLESSHTEEDYLNICKYYIHVGHVHTFSVFDRIIANGSFDRLIHGEEEDKGAILVNLDSKLGNTYKFLVNKNALLFKTITIDTTIEDIFPVLDKELAKLPINSHVRIVSNNVEILTKSIKAIQQRYSNLVVKLDKPKELKKKISIREIKAPVDILLINKDNIEELLFKELEKYNLTEQELEVAKEELRKVM